jgi:hypothetical protein
MAKCQYCEREMLSASGCIFTKLVYGKKATRETLLRQKVGDEGVYNPGERCNDCNALYGYYHHYGCDNERCPKCGRQLIICDCDISAVST